MSSGSRLSRLARNSTDWHRLLEICALSDTLILDEDGVYDPGDFNDRLLLGLKGTMSEAELHMLRARLRGGLLNQTRRRALKLPLPVGLVYDPLDRVALDPDAPVQTSLRMLFHTFARGGRAAAPARANCTGSPWNSRASSRCCTTRATPALRVRTEPARGVARAAPWSGGGHRSANGRSCCATRLPARS